MTQERHERNIAFPDVGMVCFEPMFVVLFAALGAFVGSFLGPPLLGGSVGLVLSGSIGLAFRPTMDGEILRVAGICVIVSGVGSGSLLESLSRLHICHPILDELPRLHACLPWWNLGKLGLVAVSSLALGAMLLIQSARAPVDEPSQ